MGEGFATPVDRLQVNSLRRLCTNFQCAGTFGSTPRVGLTCPPYTRRVFHPLPWEDIYAAHRETGNAQRRARARRARTSRSAPATTISSAASGCRRRRASISRTARRSPASSSARSPARPPRTSRRRSTPRTPPPMPGARRSPPTAPPSSSRSPTAWRRTFRALATVETIDNGKPIRETMAADLPLAVDHFRYFASCIRAQEGSLSEIDETTIAYHFHEPLGVVGQIIPWNFPHADGGVEARPGARRRQLRRAQAGRADTHAASWS